MRQNILELYFLGKITYIQYVMLKTLTEHRGYDEALPRKEVLKALREHGEWIDDRQMRKIKEQTPGVLACLNGYYLAREDEDAGLEDCEYSIEFFRKKIFPLWKQVEKIKKEHPEFYKYGQMELEI